MLPWLGVALLVVVLDQLTKYWIHHVLTYGQAIEVLPFLNLVLVYNPGAAFSFLSDQPGWQNKFFIAVAAAASVWVLYLLARPQRRLFSLALALILGGAIGNLFDRLILGAVVDFIDVHAAGYHWPAFNVADASITCGAALLILVSFGKQEDGTLPETAVK
ncbi:MAG: signal peptidase II [Burkholderiales bacterium]|nr:lipoprotein signal peptidase [Betaproteobacteria bacterium]